MTGPAKTASLCNANELAVWFTGPGKPQKSFSKALALKSDALGKNWMASRTLNWCNELIWKKLENNVQIIQMKSQPRVEVDDQYGEEIGSWTITESWKFLPLVISWKDRGERFLLTLLTCVADWEVVSNSKIKKKKKKLQGNPAWKGIVRRILHGLSLTCEDEVWHQGLMSS